jgi:hypothetical protein
MENGESKIEIRKSKMENRPQHRHLREKLALSLPKGGSTGGGFPLTRE